MGPSILKKRKLEDGMKGRTSYTSKKPRRKQSHYSSPSPSPSADEFAPVDLADSEPESNADADNRSPVLPSKDSPTASPFASDSETYPSDSNSSSASSKNPNQTPLKKRKRNDPTAFSASISAILNSKLSTSKRADPVLARSATAHQASHSLSEQRLETKARRQLLADKKLALEKGRVRDVLLGTGAAAVTGKEPGAGEIQEQERRLRKTAQRGVVKLFNAVRQAQVRGEEAARNAKTGGRGRREEKVNEMSKEGFLELVASGGGGVGGKGMGKGVEEA